MQPRQAEKRGNDVTNPNRVNIPNLDNAGKSNCEFGICQYRPNILGHTKSFARPLEQRSLKRRGGGHPRKRVIRGAVARICGPRAGRSLVCWRHSAPARPARSAQVPENEPGLEIVALCGRAGDVAAVISALLISPLTHPLLDCHSVDSTMCCDLRGAASLYFVDLFP